MVPSACVVIDVLRSMPKEQTTGDSASSAYSKKPFHRRILEIDSFEMPHRFADYPVKNTSQFPNVALERMPNRILFANPVTVLCHPLSERGVGCETGVVGQPDVGPTDLLPGFARKVTVQGVVRVGSWCPRLLLVVGGI